MKKSIMLMMVAAAAMVTVSCGSKKEQGESTDQDSTKTEQAPATTETKTEEKADTVKGPATIDLGRATVDVPEGWYVKNPSKSSCRIEPFVKPDIEHKGNFGWSVYISVWDGEVFKAEKFIEDDKKVFEETKKMPEVTFNGVKYMYNFYDYKFGKHSVLAAPLPEKGAINVEVGGYAVEDADVQKILKTLKLK